MDSTTSSLVSALADRYRLEREIGAGGMATVYLAKDVRHDRDVAVKVLRPEIASSIGAERFLAEIKTTANLQHPHILGLIDSGEVNGTVFYVMPFVKGESLRDRLNRELQMPVTDAVRIATQVAGALDYAHRHGVIHRDIKPENILLHDEQALVADFGIALAARRSQTGKRITEAGTSLGTPHYMSPEQAMGDRSLDARADIFALGCVLYEMLTGEPPFNGPNAQAIIAKVMTADPEPVTTVRKTVPANVAAATMMALSKLPADRFPTAAAFAAALENVQFSGPRQIAGLVPQGTFLVRKSVLFAAAAALLVAVGAMVVLIGKRVSDLPVAVARFELPIDAPATAQIHVTRDGSAIVWSAAGAYWARRLDSLGARRLRDAPQTLGSIRDVSPDGRELLVGGRGGRLAIVPVAQGAPRELLLATGGRGGVWADDGFIYAVAGGRGIARSRVSGGAADTVVRIEGARAIRDIVALPGGSILAIEDTPNRTDADSLVVFDTETGSRAALAGSTQQIQHIAFVEPDFVLFASGTQILAARLNARGRSMSEAVPFIETESSLSALAATKDVLIYRAGSDAQTTPGMEIRALSGNAGRILSGLPDDVLFSGFVVSPDGRRIAAHGAPTASAGNQQQNQNLYIYELPAGPLQRLVSRWDDRLPAWMPGGRELSFVRVDSAGRTALMHRPWDGTGVEDTIAVQSDAPFGSASWLPRGDRAIVQVGGGGGRGAGGRGGPGRGGGRGGAGGASDLVFVGRSAPNEITPFMKTDYSEANPTVSPDGRLVAYTSTPAGGRAEVFVSPVDGSTRRQVSRAGGTAPRWSRSGRELYFRSGTAAADTLYAARISIGTDIDIGAPTVAMANVGLAGGYAVLPGDTSIVMRPAGSGASRPLVVVMNFARELERLLDAK